MAPPPSMLPSGSSNIKCPWHCCNSTMSESPPPPLIYLSSETEHEDSPPPETRSPLYQSLMAAIEHLSSANVAWVDTVAMNNPRAVHEDGFKDGSMHWVDKNDNILCLAFPVIVDLHGKYGRTGPYFSLGSNITVSNHVVSKPIMSST